MVRMLPAAFLLCVSLALAVPLFHPGMFDSHEGDAYLLRLYAYDVAVQDGFPSGRWFRDFAGGAGYPFLSFYPPFFFYLGESALFLGVGIVGSVKLLIFLGLFGSGFFTYLLIRGIGGSRPVAVGGAFLYLYLPYHLMNLYVRGDLAEFTAMAMVPLCYLTLLNLTRDPGSWMKGFACAAVYAAMTLTHTITALAISPLLLTLGMAMAFTHPRRKTALLSITGALAGGILLSCYHWLPAFIELKYVQHEILTEGYYRIENHFLALRQLITSPWGYGVSVAGLDDGMSFEAGIGNLIVAVMFAAVLIRDAVRKKVSLLPGYILLMLVLSALLTLPVSQFLYDHLPLMDFMQFPWRMLLFVGFFSSLAIISIDRLTSDLRLKWILVGILMIIEVWAYGMDYWPKGVYPVHEQLYPIHFQNHRNVTTTNAGEFFSRWARDFTVIPDGEVVWIRGGPLRVLRAEKKTGWYRFRLQADAPTQVVLNCLWFPGWEARVNGAPQVIGPESVYFDETGLIQVRVPAGISTVALSLRLTPVRKYSLIISLLALFAGLAGVTIQTVGRMRKRRTKI